MSLEAGLLIGMTVILYGFFYLAMQIKGDYGFFKVFFLVIAELGLILWFSIAAVLVRESNNLATKAAEEVDGLLQVGMQLSVWVLIITLVILITLFIFGRMEALSKLPAWMQGKADDEEI